MVVDNNLNQKSFPNDYETEHVEHYDDLDDYQQNERRTHEQPDHVTKPLPVPAGTDNKVSVLE